MELANIVLQYLKVLVWPILVASSLFLFKKEICQLIATLVSMRLPGGTELTWNPLTQKQKEARVDEEIAEISEADQPKEQGDAKKEEESRTGFDRIGSPSISKEDAILAENIVMRQLKDEYEGEIRRQITFHQRPDLQFDAVIIPNKNNEDSILAEVKFVNRLIDIGPIVGREFEKVERARKTLGTRNIRALLIFVVDADDSIRLALEDAANRLSNYRDSKHEIRVYDYKTLKSSFEE